jgi:ribosome biogenesis GTPase A
MADAPDAPDESSTSREASPAPAFAGIAVRALSDGAARLATLAAELGHQDVAHAIRDDAKRRLDDGRVRIVVLGEIKHGKSTLINALLGGPLLPIGVTPTTGAVVGIRVDTQQRRTGTFLVDANGERSELEPARFDVLARGKEQDEAGRVPELLVDAERLPPTLELIDTPGFNDIDRFRAAVSRSELPRADVLVLVLDATQVLSRSELTLIRDAIAAVGGLGDSGARCLLVINRIDLVPEDERERIVEHMRSGLAEVIPGVLEPYLTDAKSALREAAQAESELAESTNEAARAVGRLRADLWALAGRGREILPARARSALLRHAKLLGYNAAIQARALRLAHTEIAEEIAAVEQAMAASVTDLATARKLISENDARIVADSEARLQQFRAELEQAARQQIDAADIHTLTQVIPGAIQDSFLDFVGHESERLRSELEQLTRDLFATYGELARRRLGDATLPLSFRGPGIYVEPPKVLIEVAMVTLGLVGTLIWYLGNTVTGMVMTIASPLTTVILREKTVRDAREQARIAVPPAIEQAVAQLREVVGHVVTRHGEALDEHLTLADRALSEQLLDGLRRADQRLLAHEAEVAKLTGTATPEATPAVEPKPTPAVEPTPERLRERVIAAAQAELGALERQLANIMSELERLNLTDAPRPEPEAPPVIH